MNMNDVLEYVYKSKRINDCIYKICSRSEQEDLKSHLIIELSKMEESKLVKIFNKGQIDWYCIGILKNQYHSHTSTFHKQYSIVYVSQQKKNGGIVGMLDVDEEIEGIYYEINIESDMDTKIDIIELLKDNENNEIDMEEWYGRDMEEWYGRDIEKYFKDLKFEKHLEEIKRILNHDIKPVDALLFNLYFSDGMSYKQIGDMAKVNPQSIRYSVVKTMAHIKEKLERYDNF